MVEDIPGNYAFGYLPILDTQMTVVNGKFLHKHYSKPMSSLEVTLQRTLMSMSAKLNIIANEGYRRLRNCSPNLPWAEQVTYLNKLMISMLYGGYSGKTRQIVARRVIAKYTNNMYTIERKGGKKQEPESLS